MTRRFSKAVNVNDAAGGAWEIRRGCCDGDGEDVLCSGVVKSLGGLVVVVVVVLLLLQSGCLRVKQQGLRDDVVPTGWLLNVVSRSVGLMEHDCCCTGRCGRLVWFQRHRGLGLCV
jgi:hypothetical protein